MAAACRPYPGRSGLPSSVHTELCGSKSKKKDRALASRYWHTVAVPTGMYQCRPGLLSTQVAVVQDKATAIVTGGEAVLMMELPRRHATPFKGIRFGPINSDGHSCAHTEECAQ